LESVLSDCWQYRSVPPRWASLWRFQTGTRLPRRARTAPSPPTQIAAGARRLSKELAAAKIMGGAGCHDRRGATTVALMPVGPGRSWGQAAAMTRGAGITADPTTARALAPNKPAPQASCGAVRAATDRVAGLSPPKAQGNPGVLHRSPGAFLGIAMGFVRDEAATPRGQRGNRVAADGVRNLFLIKKSEGANRCAGDRKAAFGCGHGA
jgi:hypothetical protein